MHIKDNHGYVVLHSDGKTDDFKVMHKEGRFNLLVEKTESKFRDLVLNYEEIEALYNFAKLTKLNK